jgi:trigger factor
MKIETKDLEKSQVELTIAITPEELNPYLDKAAVKLSQSLKIEGFRPGKAPRRLVEQYLGPEKVFSEAIQIAIPDTLIKAVTEKKLEAVGQPEVTPQKIATGNDFVYKAKIAVLPKFELPDLSDIKIARRPVKVKDSEVTKVLEDLRKSRATSAAVNRPAQTGDRVEVDFEVKMDGQTIPGGQSKNHPVVIGEKKFVPGFEDKLIGAKSGEDKRFSLTFPKDYYQKKLAGKKAEFSVSVKSVQEVKLPPLDDGFAKSVGKFKDLKSLREQIKHNLEHENSHKEENRVEMEIVEKIAAKVKIELPEVLVKGEQEKMVAELEQNLAQQGLKFEDYLKSINKTKEQLVADQADGATKRVRISLILRAVGKKENQEISEKEIAAEIEKIKKSFAAMYPGQPDINSRFETPEYRDHLQALMLNRKVFAKLKELCATGAEHKCDKD